MSRGTLSIVALAGCLVFATGCREQDLTEEAFNEAMETASDEIEDAADAAVNALGDAVEDADEVIEDAYTEAARALEEAMKENNSDAE